MAVSRDLRLLSGARSHYQESQAPNSVDAWPIIFSLCAADNSGSRAHHEHPCSLLGMTPENLSAHSLRCSRGVNVQAPWSPINVVALEALAKPDLLIDNHARGADIAGPMRKSGRREEPRRWSAASPAPAQ
jgi:hypothetical protein